MNVLRTCRFANILTALALVGTMTAAERGGNTPSGLPVAPRDALVFFARPFAPHEGLVKSIEQPWRAEICLNGAWQFQPVPLPADYRHGAGAPPELPPPQPDGWGATPIKIPSPWNVNRWGPGRRGRDVGEGTARPYFPDSEYFPSYPRGWDDAPMGWLRRTFRVPSDWRDKRVVLHFEAVAGEFQVFVNGAKAGGQFDSWLPAEFDITALVKRDADNELLVGVRHPRLFDQRSPKYSKFISPYPPGSDTSELAGIWQDVFLLGLPAVRVTEAFVQPFVDQDRLSASVTLRNDSAQPITVELSGQVQAWSNEAGTNILDAPEPKWRLGETALSFAPSSVRIAPGTATNVVLNVQPAGRLKHWSPAAPNLYGLVVTLAANGTTLDSHYARFGWRQLTLHGREARLNGEPIRMVGDLSHPFGAFMMSRRFAWAWFRMIKDAGGNAVRLHAQPFPRYYLDVADEMGLLVLAETAAFGSSIRLNPDAPQFWERYAAHYERLIRRDRNHPSVFGWSFGNEMFAIPNLNQMSPADTAAYYDKLAALGLRAREWDPTRAWISCDGDEDLGGRLPVWSKHYGHDLPAMPTLGKPQMVGESGGTYYATPKQLAVFNGDRAYESYLGRNEALAIDLYQNLVQLARPNLAYFSPSELVWFGFEHLPLGRRDFAQVPTLAEGIFFGPYVEGRPGMQPERLPPYCGTLNPGWDPALPLYRPLPMFHAMKAALDPAGPRPCEWDHRPTAKPIVPPAAQTPIEQVAIAGPISPALKPRLGVWGLPLLESKTDHAKPALTLVDAATLTDATLPAAQQALVNARAKSGLVLVLAGAGANAESLAKLLPIPAHPTTRTATALSPDRTHPWTASLTLPELYFAEDGNDRFILRHGLDGPFVQQGRVLLRASDTDWSLFNHQPEHSKCGALLLHEQLTKPSGAALVIADHGRGKLALCSLDHRVATRNANALWRRLFTGMGVRLIAPSAEITPAFNEDGVLLNALSIGRFGAANIEAALTAEHLGQRPAPPRAGQVVSGRTWVQVNCPSKDRFLLHQLKQAGPADAFAVYFSCWINSPRALDDLLLGGPEAPKVALACYVSEQCRVHLNGTELKPTRTEPADYRTLLTFEGVPLKKGWNHLLLKVAAARLEGEQPATLAVRLRSNQPEFFHQLESAVETPPPMPRQF